MIVPQFNEYSANCLYCNTSCIPSQESEWSHTPIVSVVKTTTWTCNNCNEMFVVKGIEDADVPDSFSFTCKNITVFIQYKISNVVLMSNKSIFYVDIPIFNIDFSDKEKLYNKLKTYLLFS